MGKKKTIIGLISFTFLLVCCKLEHQSQIGKEFNSEITFPFKDYDKVETYSFNRDKNFIDSINQEIIKYELEFSPKELFDSNEISLTYETLQQLKEKGESSIILEQKSIAKSSQKIKVLSNKELINLKGIFRYTKQLADESLCTLIYRDALVFKKQNKIVGWINICFDCAVIQSHPNHYFLFSIDQWKELKDFFLKIGHPIKE